MRRGLGLRLPKSFVIKLIAAYEKPAGIFISKDSVEDGKHLVIEGKNVRANCFYSVTKACELLDRGLKEIDFVEILQER